MDIFAMLQNATIVDVDDEGETPVGAAVGFEVIHGRMRIKIILFNQDSDADDPDDGEEEDVPEESPKVADADASEGTRPQFPTMVREIGNRG